MSSQIPIGQHAKPAGRASSTVVLVGGFLINATSRTQCVISQSSGEAEYIAGTASASEGLYVSELFKSCGFETKLLIHIDSTLAIGTAIRRGLTRIRHLDVRFLWLQSVCAEKRLELRKCPGEENCADSNTKAACKASLEFCRSRMGVAARDLSSG